MRAHHLGGQEGGRSIAALEILVSADDDFGAAKIAERYRTPGAHQHVLGLQVSVDHLVEVQVVQSLLSGTQVLQRKQRGRFDRFDSLWWSALHALLVTGTMQNKQLI